MAFRTFKKAGENTLKLLGIGLIALGFGFFLTSGTTTDTLKDNSKQLEQFNEKNIKQGEVITANYEITQNGDVKVTLNKEKIFNVKQENNKEIITLKDKDNNNLELTIDNNKLIVNENGEQKTYNLSQETAKNMIIRYTSNCEYVIYEAQNNPNVKVIFKNYLKGCVLDLKGQTFGEFFSADGIFEIKGEDYSSSGYGDYGRTNVKYACFVTSDKPNKCGGRNYIKSDGYIITKQNDGISFSGLQIHYNYLPYKIITKTSEYTYKMKDGQGYFILTNTSFNVKHEVYFRGNLIGKGTTQKEYEQAYAKFDGNYTAINNFLNTLNCKYAQIQENQPSKMEFNCYVPYAIELNTNTSVITYENSKQSLLSKLAELITDLTGNDYDKWEKVVIKGNQWVRVLVNKNEVNYKFNKATFEVDNIDIKNALWYGNKIKNIKATNKKVTIAPSNEQGKELISIS